MDSTQYLNCSATPRSNGKAWCPTQPDWSRGGEERWDGKDRGYGWDFCGESGSGQEPYDCTYNPGKNKPMDKKLSDDHLLYICWLSCDHMIIIWWSLMIFFVHPYLTCGSLVECKVGDWKPWGACSVTCGAGNKTRAREVIEEGTIGSVCPALEETTVCNMAVEQK